MEQFIISSQTVNLTMLAKAVMNEYKESNSHFVHYEFYISSIRFCWIKRKS
jgi:hypothetical protein